MATSAYIYEIKNKVNGNCYIGSTINPKARWTSHRGTLRAGKHHSFILQKAWDKHGESNFNFQVLLECDKKDMIDYENRFMVLQYYNVLRTAKECLVRGGWKHTEDFKQRMSKIRKGRAISEEQKELISKALKGRKHTQEYKDNCRTKRLGTNLSDLTRLKLSKALQNARKKEVEATNAIALQVYKAYDGSETISSLCKRFFIEKTTFYGAIKRLGLSNLKHGVK